MELEPGREPFRRDEYRWYTGYSETRILVDPYWIEYGNASEAFSPIILLANYSWSVSTPTKIDLVYPKYLRPSAFRRWEGAFFSDNEITYITQRPDSDIRDDNVLNILREARNDLQNNIATYSQQPERLNQDIGLVHYISTTAFHVAVELMELAHILDCDYLLTSNPLLLGVADKVLNIGVHVYSAERLIPSLERFLRASGVFISVGQPTSLAEDMVNIANPTLETFSVGAQGLGFQVFYQMTAPLTKYITWYYTLQRQKQSDKLLTFGRSAFFHRFPFLLYSSDLVQYHYESSTRFTPHDRPRQDHRFYVLYHANLFYLNIAGFLDNLAWLFNYYLDLQYLETNRDTRSPHFRGHCGLGRSHFLKSIQTRWPTLHELLQRLTFREWVRNLTIKRDPAAHREFLYMASISEQDTNRLLTDTHMITETPDGYVMFDIPSGVVEDIKKLNTLMEEITRLNIPAI